VDGGSLTDDGMELKGSERAAILLMSLDDGDAAAVLRLMEPREVEQIAAAMARMENVSREQLGVVVDAFSDALKRQAKVAPGTRAYISRLITDAVGEKRARGLVSRVLDDGQSRGLEALRWMDTREIRSLIADEHPQITAIILAHVSAQQAGEILRDLPAELRNEILLRIATLEDLQESVLEELDSMVAARADEEGVDLRASVAGRKVAADILNIMDREVESEVLDYLRATDEAMSLDVEEQMFSFEVLLRIQGRGVQTLLREITNEQLIVALKGADEEIKELIFSNMSKRAGEMLREDLGTRGPVRIADVEEAQKAILAVAKRLSDEGQIMIGMGANDFV
jgi:flagellar motor switch protein FliG